MLSKLLLMLFIQFTNAFAFQTTKIKIQLHSYNLSGGYKMVLKLTIYKSHALVWQEFA